MLKQLYHSVDHPRIMSGRYANCFVDNLGQGFRLGSTHYLIITTANRTPGSRSYSDLVDTKADSVCIHQLILMQPF